LYSSAVHEPHPLPLFALPNSEIFEGRTRLEPDDTLVVCSDRLVEIDEHALPLNEYQQEMEQAEDAEALVRRLLGKMPACPPLRHLTVVAVHRLV
jgi:hypothetical protein